MIKIGMSCCLLVLVPGIGSVFAADTILWTEGFETYNMESGQDYGSLDKNLDGGPNAAANGVGNPWFGFNPSNGWVTKAMTNPEPVVETVTPHGGQFMIRGNRGSEGWYNTWDNDNDNVNIAYRFNSGVPFKTAFMIDWWFYDAIGNNNPGDPDLGPGNFGDWAAVEFRPDAPTDTDYVNNGTLSAPTAALSIGAYEATTGYTDSVYQVQVQGASDAQFGDGWFNTNLTRSKGWHHATILVDVNSMATLSIDGTVLLVHDTGAGAGSGFNVFSTYELKATPGTYNQSAYYDDITLTRLDPTSPAINAAVSRKTQGSAGTFDIDVRAANAVECRKNGPTQVVVTFDRPIKRVSGTVSDVSVSTGTVSALAVNGNQLEITMSGATDGVLLTVGFPGIRGPYGQIVTGGLCFGVLAGDATGDKKVNVFDLLAVKNVVNQPVTNAIFRNDVTAEGGINVFDLLAVKNNLNKTITASCP